MKKLTGIILLSFLAFSCAKDRPIDELQHPDHEWQQKDALTGTNKDLKPNVWISRTSVVKTSENSGFAFVGSEGPTKVGYFKFTKEKLQFLDATALYESSHYNAPTPINEWDINHHDVKLQETGGKIRPVEIEDDRKTWDQKKYFTVNFSTANVSEAANFPWSVGIATKYECWRKFSSSLVEDSLEVLNDYMTFVVEVNYQRDAECNQDMLRSLKDDYIYTVQYRYSFKKYNPDPTYKPMVYQGGDTDPLMKAYGYFQTVRTEINPSNNRKKNTIFVNRWHPEKEHNYYFAKGFPQEWKWIFNDPEKGIFPLTNKLLKEAGLKTRFHVRENTWGDGKEKNIGDIRYSFVNIIEKREGGAPLGYGPSSADPYTGEIISGNITLWTSSLKYYIELLAQMEESRNKEGAKVLGGIKSTLENDNLESLTKELSNNSEALKVFNAIVQDKTIANPRWNSFVRSRQGDLVERKLERSELMEDHHGKVEFLLGKIGKGDVLEDVNHHVQDSVNSNLDIMVEKYRRASMPNHSCLYSVTDAVTGASDLILEGKSAQEVMTNILYTTAIHEFGHTINLRHNFYGSVDSKNFKKPNRQDGYVTNSSSVMDYIALSDEVHAPREWGLYDEAAILFAYSSGNINRAKETPFMFCTDQHRPLNPMCNTWDKGDTPSKVLLDKIKKYEISYDLNNYRNNRAFWDTSYYASSAFQTMYEVKTFVSLWLRNLTPRAISDFLARDESMDRHEKEDAAIKIRNEMINTTKLTLGFYNSILQLKNSDRTWRDDYDDWTGAINRIGVQYDKIFALRFMAGDEGLMNYRNESSFLSYLGFSGTSELRGLVRKSFENIVTKRMEMDIWFTGYARALYAANASNYYNIDDTSLLGAIKVVEVSPENMEKYFGINPDDIEVVKTLSLNQVRYTKEFSLGEEVGIAYYEDNYYMVSKADAPYAYTEIEKLEDLKDEGSPQPVLELLYELHRLYKFSKVGR